MIKKFLPYIFLFLILFVIGFLISQKESSDNIVKRTQILLGTAVEIQIRDIEQNKADSLIQLAFDEIKRVDTLFSNYIKESSVYEINHSSDSVSKVNDEIFNLINLSDSLWRISNGAFDVSLDALINTWGFDSDNPHLPDSNQIKIALNNSGWNNIELQSEKILIRKNNVKLNFGAIAKGYAVDRAIKILQKNYVKKALVNAGGEIRGIGEGWVVGVQHPRMINRLIAKIKLNGKSVATSGDYENYFIENDIRYHHILNPETGYSARGEQSVTIISENDTFADGLSTAVFVLGKEDGMNLIESFKGIEGMIVDDEGKVFYSSGFEKFIVE